MSSIYVSEPPTKGKVIVQTTHGPLDIELWPKEAPLAVRNFVQLCLEGYYLNSIFHRIIKSFLVQGGDPTGTGTGGESIYGGAFSDEFHSRLRFKHRGLVACAHAGSPHSNGSQFFISLDRCDWIDRKNTIFGKVTGDSIYNLLRVGEVETDKNDRPLDPAPKITLIDVLWNPFDDIVPRVIPGRSSTPLISDTESKDPKKKSVKKLNLLSFGEEAEEEDKELTAAKQKIRSSHDVLDDPRLLKDVSSNRESSPSEVKRTRDLQLSVREALTVKKEVSQNESIANALDSIHHSEDDEDDDNEANFDARMRQQVLKKRVELGDQPTKRNLPTESFSSKDGEMSIPRPMAEDFDHGSKMEKLSMKRKGVGSEARAVQMAKANVDLQLLNESGRVRELKIQKRRRIQGRQDEVLAKLQNFKKAIAANHIALEGGEDDDFSDWRSHRLKLAPERGKDDMSRREDPNDYAVLDPLLEKGKEKFNKMQAKQKQREREWAGKSLT